MANPPSYQLIQTVNPAVSTGTITASPANTKVGSLICVFVGSSALTDTVSTVTDNAGNSYIQQYQVAAGSGGNTELWTSANAKPTTSITVTFSASVSTKSVFVREYGAMYQQNVPVLDTTGATSGSGTSVTVSTNNNTRADDELVVCNCSCLGTNPTLSAGAGYGNFLTQTLIAGLSLHGIEDKTQTTAGAQTGTMTAGGTSPVWDVGVAAFFIADTVVNFPYPHVSVGDGCSRNDWAT